MEKSCQNSFKKGFFDGLPIGLGYLSVSFAFGIKAVQQGFPASMAVLMSMTNLTSAGQFAGLDLIIAGGSFIEMALTQFVINLRYARMSISLSQKLSEKVTLPQRMLIAFGNTDEVFAVAVSNKEKVGKKYMYGLILLPYIGWTLGTLMGAVAGNVLPESLITALGIAIYGMFIAIVVPPMKKSKAVATVVAIAIALNCAFKYLPYLNQVSSGFVIIICAVTAAAIGAKLQPINDIEDAAKEEEYAD